MSRIIEEKLPGLLYLEGTSFEDHRGRLSKPFWNSVVRGFVVDEVFSIISKKNVIRGMHYQAAPFGLGKFISVSRGKILDVVVDLRKKSPTYGKHVSYILGENDGRGLYIPPGLAHGYLTLEEESTVNYVQSGKHSPAHEKGIHFNSFGFDWKVERPILSERDMKLPPFDSLVTFDEDGKQ